MNIQEFKTALQILIEEKIRNGEITYIKQEIEIDIPIITIHDKTNGYKNEIYLPLTFYEETYEHNKKKLI